MNARMPKRIGAAIALAVTMAALAFSPGRAQGDADQVVAKIGPTRITRAMLRQEMPGGVDNPAIERAVLQSIITRTLLADEARRQGLDRTPVGAMMVKRAGEIATVGLLEKKFAGTPQPVSDAQVRDFIGAHPAMFAQRRLIGLDQFLVATASKDTTQRLTAANSMSEFQDVLTRDRVNYSRGSSVLDTINVPPDAAAKISAFGPGQVFITPAANGGLALSGVTSNTLAPIAGPSAERMARTMLQRAQIMQKVQKSGGAIIKAGQDKVKINPQFAPKKP